MDQEEMDRYSCDGKLKALCSKIAAWRQRKGFETSWRNVPEKLMLITTELAEAMEAFRHLDRERLLHSGVDALPVEQTKHIEDFKEEIADAAIRIFDLAGSLDLDLEREVASKMQVNEGRPFKHGKQC